MSEQHPSERHHSRLTWTRRALALLLAFGLVAAACGNDDDEAGDIGTAPAPTAAEEAPAPAGEEDMADDGADDADSGMADDGDADADDGADDTDSDADGGMADDGDSDADSGMADETSGCAENGLTDPSDMSSDRVIARCEPGYPVPQPLAERQTVRLANRFRAEFVAPILLAEHYGLFEEENIEVEWVELSLTDSMVPLDNCDVDFAVGGTEASFHNGVAQGLDVRMVVGNFFPPDAGDASIAQTGLWVRRDVFSDPQNPDITELQGARVASAVGLGSVIVYPMAQAFADAGFSLLDLEFERIPSSEMLIALENNAVQGAWLLDPYWIDASENPDDYVLMVTQTPGEPLGGLYAGPCVRTGDRREAGEAFVRAYIRAINTYLPPDYQDNAEVMEALVEQTGAPLESLERTPGLYFDWEIRDTTSQNAQGFFIEFETVEYEEVLPDDQVIDRSLYEAAVTGG